MMPSSIASAPPLGPVVCYEWEHPGRLRAVLCLEQRAPFRINFITYLSAYEVTPSSVRTESGWHGQWFEQVCRTAVHAKNRRRRLETAEGRQIALRGVCFLGMDTDWPHDMELFRGVGEEEWRVLYCSCGTRHEATMSEMKGLVEFTADVHPGMDQIHGIQVR